MIKVNGFQVAPAEIEAVLHGHPAVLDCAVFGLADERAGEVPVAAVQLDPAQPVADGRAPGSWWPARWPPTSSCATWSCVDAIPRLPSGKVLRRTLRDEWTPVLVDAGTDRLMDVRLSPEQQALRDSAAQVVDRLGPAHRRPSSTTPSGPTSSTPPWPPRAGASCGRRRTGGAPLASGVEVAIVAEELGRGLADAPFLGPTLAAELRRLAGARRRPPPETVVLVPTLSGLGRGRRRRGARRRRGRRRPGRRPPPWCWCPPAAGHRPGRGPARPLEPRHRPDPTRRRSPSPGRRPSAVDGQAGSLTDDDLAAWTALGLALTCADLVGTMRGAVDLAVGVRRRPAGSSAGPSARSRPSSTCWPTPSC